MSNGDDNKDQEFATHMPAKKKKKAKKRVAATKGTKKKAASKGMKKKAAKKR
jgi:hypothetical protein